MESRHADPSLNLLAAAAPLAAAGRPERNYTLSSDVYSWNIDFGHHPGQVDTVSSVFCNDL